MRANSAGSRPAAPEPQGSSRLWNDHAPVMPLLDQSRRLALMLLSTALSRFPAERRVAMAVLTVFSGLGGKSRQLSCRVHRPLAAARAVRRFSPPSTPCRCGALRNCWTCLFRSGAAGMPWALADSVALGAVLPVPVLGRGADMALRPSALGCRRLTARRSGPSCRAPCPTCAKALDRNGPLPKPGAKAKGPAQDAGPCSPASHQSKSSLPSWFRRVSSITNVSAPARITTSLPTWLAAPRTSPQLSKRA